MLAEIGHQKLRSVRICTVSPTPKSGILQRRKVSAPVAGEGTMTHDDAIQPLADTPQKPASASLAGYIVWGSRRHRSRHGSADGGLARRINVSWCAQLYDSRAHSAAKALSLFSLISNSTADCGFRHS